MEKWIPSWLPAPGARCQSFTSGFACHREGREGHGPETHQTGTESGAGSGADSGADGGASESGAAKSGAAWAV